MGTKLTLYMDENLVDKAKRLAEQDGVSLSGLISNYLRSITGTVPDVGATTPKVSALTGILDAISVSEEDHIGYLEEKHR